MNKNSLIYEIYSKVEKKGFAITFSILFIAFIVEIITTIMIPEWRKYFFDIIELKQANLFIYGLVYYSSILLILGTAQGLKDYFVHRSGLYLRTAIIKVIQKKWILTGKLDHEMNPPQRIADDSRICTDLSLRIFVEIAISIVISMGLIFSINSNTVLLVSALSYAAVSMLSALFFRKPLINRKMELQAKEGDFRNSLVKISFDGGDYTSKSNYQKVIFAYKRYISMLMNYTLFGCVQNRLAAVIPFIILTPAYFAGNVTLGDVMQGVSIFELLVVNATICVQLYPAVTEAQSSWIRVKEIYNNLN